jgi:hypothetical protein
LLRRSTKEPISRLLAVAKEALLSRNKARGVKFGYSK